MYLKKAFIKNNGPLEDIFVEFPFDKKGDPKPILLVGENGTGKTIFISSIVDSIYEYSNQIFDDVLPTHGLGYKYYKVSGGINQSVGKDYGLVALEYSQVNTKGDYTKLEYLDKTGKVDKSIIGKNLDKFKLNPGTDKENKKLTTNISSSIKQSMQKEFRNNPYIYLPANRFERAFWKNPVIDEKDSLGENIKFSNQLGKEIEVITSLAKNKSFLLNLVLDSYLYKEEADRQKWEQINTILKKIRQNENVRFGVGPRGGYRVSIMEETDDGREKQILPSVDNLSLGELLLLNLFLSILRHSGDRTKNLTNIEGIVLIDEADVHLHTELKRTVLPELIELFPKIQFIITTHEPLFLLGMQEVFGNEGLEIRELPSGNIISTERFSEFEKAYIHYTQTQRYEKDLRVVTKKSQKPIVFCEGETDPKYIKKAAELLNKQGLLEKVDFRWLGHNTPKGPRFTGKDNLNKVFSFYKGHQDLIPQNIILLYDNDSGKSNKDIGKLSVRKIPKNNKKEVIEKGIENLFTLKTIKKVRKAEKGLIKKKSIENDDQEIVKNYFVSNNKKTELCNYLCQNGTKEDFKNFIGIFDTIENIVTQDSND